MWTERSICWGSPLESKLFADDYDGCDRGTFSDHALWTECGYLALRQRQEAVLRAHLPLLAQYLATDAQQQLFDHFVFKRFQGGQGAQEYARTLMDSTAEAPLPEFEPNVYSALEKAAQNVRSMYADALFRYKKIPGTAEAGWETVGKKRDALRSCGGMTVHTVPSETPGMKTFLSDMKAKFLDVWGAPPGSVQTDNIPPSSRFSPYWSVLEELLEPNYMGSGWQEGWGEQGADSVQLPFPRISRLYYVDEKNRIRPKKPLADYLDKWAPGWRGSIRAKAVSKLDAGRISAYSPSAILAAKQAAKKAADEQKALEAKKLKTKEEAAKAKRAALAVGGSVLVAGVVALLYSQRKQSNG